ncbi:alpha/beta fold hydrolase [Spongiibacter sp. KMU-158]|uniref:Alpha/beta fold hydrolase n=1 Tax=Spongiibacter pelagi TaxID=2760804 RepID=A0A927C1K2_9GAMM|nr:alpha/beta fold hydrolase [Spongiibacter pelagi]MBD2858192.1 alpha/beta fold hydrolase [Spongiibacter pelagi]
MSFIPPPALQNPHAQSILASTKLRKIFKRRHYQAMQNASKSVVIDCGDGVQLLGEHSAQPTRSKGLVILIHGWEGSSQSTYLLTLGGTLYNAGYEIFRLNLRDHGDSHHLNRELFHSVRIDEVLNAIAQIQATYPHDWNFLAGFSLGGNFALRIAAAGEQDKIKLDYSIGICPVVDPVKTMHALEQGWWVYEKYFIRKWKRSLGKKLALYPETAAGKAMLEEKSLRGMNQHFVPHHTPFEDTEDYLNGYALKGDALANLSRRAHIISAKDDPMILAEDFSSLPENPQLEIELTEYGGHCGFVANYRLDSWIDQRVLELISLARHQGAKQKMTTEAV